MSRTDEIEALADKVRQGGSAKYHQANTAAGKLFCRERIALLCDDGARTRRGGILANAVVNDLPEDGVVTGIGVFTGNRSAIMANDSTVKAGYGGPGPWKRSSASGDSGTIADSLIYRSIRRARGSPSDRHVPPAPSRRPHLHNQVKMSGACPPGLLLFGPSAAGGAYIPAFCDVVFMVDKNASMYLGSPRMAEMVIGEKVTLEEMGGSGCTARFGLR